MNDAARMGDSVGHDDESVSREIAEKLGGKSKEAVAEKLAEKIGEWLKRSGKSAKWVAGKSNLPKIVSGVVLKLMKMGFGDGRIQSPCSDNVFVNGRGAARVGDCASCSEEYLMLPLPHSAIFGVVLSKGSKTVFINGRPAVRKGDSVTCGGLVTGGSGDVGWGG